MCVLVQELFNYSYQPTVFWLDLKITPFKEISVYNWKSREKLILEMSQASVEKTLLLFCWLDVVFLSSCHLNIWIYAHRSCFLSASMCHGRELFCTMRAVLQRLIICQCPKNKLLLLCQNILTLNRTWRKKKPLLQSLMGHCRRSDGKTLEREEGVECCVFFS